MAWRRSRLLVLAAAFVRQAARQWQVIAVGEQPYLIGDWTISYAGGFVRRGLFGTLLLLARPDADGALVLLWAVQTALYAVIFGTVMLWVVRLPSAERWAILLLSPAFLLFGLSDFGGTHRKEIIALAALVLLAEAVRSGRRLRSTVIVSAALFAVAVLSHEANALLLVPFLLLIRTAGTSRLLSGRAARTATIAYAAIGGGGLVASVLAPGTIEQQRRICDDLLARGFSPELCGGSLAYIGRSTADGWATVLERMPDILLYGLPLLFAILPLTLVPWARANARLLLLASAPLLPLLVVGVDWGRWIMLGVFLATVLAIVGSAREASVPDRVPVLWLLLFVTAWRLPHAGLTPDGLGPNGLVAILRGALAAASRAVGLG